MDSQRDNGMTFETSKYGVCIDWQAQNIRYEHSFINGELARRARQPDQGILKACSNRKKTVHSVLDLTGGWGLDSFILASHGKQVTLVEKNATVFDVIRQSLQQLGVTQPGNQAFDNFHLVHGNSLDFLTNPDLPDYDCIYLDPMFPSHKSGAKPSKSLQILQALTDNEDIEAIFRQALKRCRNRVVVKRPLKAPSLANRQPDQVLREKTIRFDIYLAAPPDPAGVIDRNNLPQG